MAGLANALTAGFPFYAWWIGWDERAWTGTYLAVIAIARLLAITSAQDSKNLLLAAISGALAVLTIGVAGRYGTFYPVAINALLFVVFFGSILFPPSAIERLAIIKQKKVGDALGRYLRGLTMIWCCIFALNGSIAATLAVLQYKTAWFVYNGIIAYVLVFSLLFGEILLRPRIRMSTTHRIA